MTGAEPVDVRAAGAVVWRPTGEIALVHRPRHDDWSFPKGKLEPGETAPFAAVREVAEEAGVAVTLGPSLGEIRYQVAEGAKLVRYWAAPAGAGSFAVNEETDELAWVPPSRARELLTYPHDLDVLARFVARGRPSSILVLVRHAKAGSRQNWDGPDALRPLSSPGREQAGALAGFLALFGPRRIVSAPPLRCRDTVAPLASALGLTVADEPLLGEEGYWADPTAGFERFRALAAEPGVTLIAGQGGVIPDVVSELVKRFPQPGIDAAEVPARKASTWVLGFAADGALSSADHYRLPTG